MTKVVFSRYLKPQERKQCILEAVAFWKTRSEDYRSRVNQYRTLLKEMREKRLQPLYVLSVEDIREYPKVDFLIIESEEEVKDFLNGLPDYRLERLVEQTKDDLQTNYAYVTIGARIADYRFILANCGKKQFTRGAPDPDRCARSRPKCPKHLQD